MAAPDRAPTFCPNCGEQLVHRVAGGRDRLSCPTCHYVHYHNPVPSVGILIEMDDGLVLVKRGGHIKTGQWAFPSGYIEADESVEEAAIRESKEETGLDVRLTNLIGVYSFPEGPPSSGIIVFYRALPIGGELHAGDDAEAVQVFAPENLPEMPFRTHREVLQRWQALNMPPGAGHPAIPTYAIRQAEPDDLPAVMNLMRLVDANTTLNESDWQAATQRFLERQALHVFVAERLAAPQEVIGFLALSQVQTLTGARGWIEDMAVAVGFQGVGIGAALLEETLRHANRLGLTHLYVNIARGSPAARAFYEAAGFQEGPISTLRIR